MQNNIDLRFSQFALNSMINQCLCKNLRKASANSLLSSHRLKLKGTQRFTDSGQSVTQCAHKAVIGQRRSHMKLIGFGVVVRVLPIAVQTQTLTQQSSLERPPLPPEGLKTGEVLGQRKGGGRPLLL